MSWHQAEVFCVERGGHLASIRSKKEEDMVHDVASAKDVWLGGKKGRDNSWSWLDGNPWQYRQNLDIDDIGG